MRHRKKRAILDRKSGPRTGLLRSLFRALITYGHITTTTARAKAVRAMAEKALSTASTPTLSHRRILIELTGSPQLVARTIETAKKYEHRNSGYIRIYRRMHRKGDWAQTVTVTLLHN